MKTVMDGMTDYMLYKEALYASGFAIIKQDELAQLKSGLLSGNEIIIKKNNELAELIDERDILVEQAKIVSKMLVDKDNENARLRAELKAKELRCPSCRTKLSAQDGYWYCINDDCGQAPENDRLDTSIIGK